MTKGDKVEIDSVRALKAEISETLIMPLVAEGRNLQAFGIPAASKRLINQPQPAIALGISKGKKKGDFVLAVRLQRRSLERDPRIVEWLAQKASKEIDVRYIGRLTKLATPWHQLRHRPLLIGASIGHHAVTAGTTGAFVQHRKSRKTVILSNNHVLANEDKGKPGDAILQPGAYDNGMQPGDVVGALLDAVKMKNSANLVDAAIASISADIEYDPLLLTNLGKLAGLRASPLDPGDRVAKVGRTTGLTHGVVTAIEVDDVVVGYERGSLSFDSQIEVEGTGDAPFSAGGDSGSMIVDAEFKACALLFAGGDTGGTNGKGLTYANDFHMVLSALNIDLVI